jgi:hypothetical protein
MASNRTLTALLPAAFAFSPAAVAESSSHPGWRPDGRHAGRLARRAGGECTEQPD